MGELFIELRIIEHVSMKTFLTRKRKLFFLQNQKKKPTRIDLVLHTVRVFDLFNYKVALIQQFVTMITFTFLLTNILHRGP